MIFVKKWGIILLKLAIIVLLIAIFEMKGLIGLLIWWSAGALYSVWKNRDQVKLAMENIECMIFGKPLDKNNWKIGELQARKVKYVWRKKR